MIDFYLSPEPVLAVPSVPEPPLYNGRCKSAELLKPPMAESADGDGDGETLAPLWPLGLSGESLNKLAPSGVNSRQSPSSRVCWCELESLDMRPKRPKKNSNAISSVCVVFIYFFRPYTCHTYYM